MIIKRAVATSFLAYACSFVVVIAAGVLLGTDVAERQAISPLVWYVGSVASGIFAFMASWWYFRSPRILPGFTAGMALGAIMVALGAVLDFITLLPLWRHDNPTELILDYYTEPLFWITAALVFTAATLTGKLKLMAQSEA